MVLPTLGSLVSSIRKGNPGIIPGEYPFAYAHRFIIAYPETIPDEIKAKVAKNPMISTPARTAAATLQHWADKAGEDKHRLATILADTYISLHHNHDVKKYSTS